MSSAQRPSLPPNNRFSMASQSHTLRPRAEVYDIRNAYESDRSYHSSSSSEQSYRQRNSDSDRSYQTQPTEYSGSPVQRPIIHYGYTCEGRIERSPDRYFPEKEPQASPRASVETYASTVPSEEDFGDEGIPEYDLPEYQARPYESDVLAATPSDFSELFPSARRLAIRHDDSTLDGNMNLRVDTQIRSNGRETAMTLFHLRMHDLKNREFSLRRYCRDSGREVCHSVRKNQATTSEKRPGFQRSLSNALNVMRPKSESRAPTLSSLKRNDSGYGSMHDSDFDVDERPRTSGGVSKAQQQQMTHTIKLEFSNYAQVDIKRIGAKANKRYEFEYWGVSYAWKRVVKKEGHAKEVSFHLVRVGTEQVLAYIAPVPLSRSQAQQERQKGGWIPPCSMWIQDERIIKSQKDISDVVVSAGLMALVDNTVRERFHSKTAKQMLLPKVEYVGPKRLINEMFRRDSGNNSNQSRSGSRSRPSTSHAGSTSSRVPTGAVRQASNDY